MVILGQQPFALPLSSVVEIFNLDLTRTNTVDGQLTIRVRDRALPLFYLRNWLVAAGGAMIQTDEKHQGHVVVVNVGGIQVGLVVDFLVGQEEVVIKPLGALLQGLDGMADIDDSIKRKRFRVSLSKIIYELPATQVSKSEKKVVRTMIAVTASFVICWLPAYFVIMLGLFVAVPTIQKHFQILATLAYANILINPLIYCAHIDILRRTWRATSRMFTSAETGAEISTSGAPLSLRGHRSTT